MSLPPKHQYIPRYISWMKRSYIVILKKYTSDLQKKLGENIRGKGIFEAAGAFDLFALDIYYVVDIDLSCFCFVLKKTDLQNKLVYLR